MKKDEIDIDIYVSYYSKLTIPSEDIKKYSSNVEGFKAVIPEALLVLKQGAEVDRGNSVKGEKDRIDIFSLLFFSHINFKKYKEILKTYGLEDYINRLISLIRNFKEVNYFPLNLREFKQKKEKILGELKKL